MPQELRSTWSTEPSETQLVYCNASQCFTFYLASKNLAHLYSSHFKPVAARCSGGQARRGSELLSSKWSDFPNHARITPCCKLHSWSDLPGTTSVQVSSSCPARVDPCPWCQWPPLIASNYEVTNEIWKGDFALTGDMQFQDKLEQMFDAFSVHAFQYNFDTNSMTLGPTGRKKTPIPATPPCKHEGHQCYAPEPGSHVRRRHCSTSIIWENKASDQIWAVLY